MNLGLEGRVVVIGGSSRGIGRGIAEAFLAEGASVTITGRTAVDVEEAAGALGREAGHERVLPFVGDLTTSDGVQRLSEAVHARWSQVDHVVTNAGSGRSSPGAVVDEAEWTRVAQLNFGSAVRLIDAFLPAMMERRRGSVVAVASIAGLETLGAPIAYGAAKAALVHYVSAVARLTGAAGVRANCVAPGNVFFPGGRWAELLAADEGGVRAMLARDVPLGRFGTPEEIAAAVVFLTSDRASFVTGTCVTVDGGQTRSPH